MGVVYRARQLDLDRDVAIKVITPELVDDERTRARFLSEARAAAAVEHPNVLPVYGAGVADGQAYLVMRYVHGDDLRTLVRREGPLSPERAAAIAVALGDALDAIHRAGYVHRDVKPANVLLDETGHVYLSDFGLAKHALATAGLTESGRWVGTLDFAAPEQIRGGKVDARADVYALGGVLHFMLTGAVPFDRDSDEAKLWAHLGRSAAAAVGAAAGPARRARRRWSSARWPSSPTTASRRRATSAARHGRPSGARGRARADGASVRGAGAAPAQPACSTARRRSPTPACCARARPARATRCRAARCSCWCSRAATAAVAGDRGRRRTASADRAALSPTSERRDAADPQVGETVEHVGFRPRGIAVADGDLWVISAERGRLARIDAESLRPHGTQPLIGRGAVSVAAHGDSVWVAVSRQGRVIELDSRHGSRAPAAARCRSRRSWSPPAAAGSGSPGTGRARRPTCSSTTTAPAACSGRPTSRDDITALEVGGGRAWVAHAGVAAAARLRRPAARARAGVADGRRDRRSRTAAGASGRAFPATTRSRRYDPRDNLIVTTEVARRPAGLAVAGGRVFVASTTDHTVVVVDPKTGRPGRRSAAGAAQPLGGRRPARRTSGCPASAPTPLSRIDY